MRAGLFFAFAALAFGCSSDPPKTYGPVYGDDAGKDGAPSDAAPTDGAPIVDAAPDAKSDAATCASTTAVVAGNASSLAWAIAVGGGAFTGAGVAGSAIDRIGVVAGATSFTYVVRAQGDAMFSASSTGTTFAAPTAVGASTRDAPSLAVTAAGVQLLYQASDFKYYRAILSSGTWSPTAETVGTGSGQSFGPRGPSVAAVGNDLVVLQGGDDTILYDRTWNGSWQAPHAQAGTAVDKSLSPAVARLDGGNAELLVAYVRPTDFKIMSVTRASGVWSSPVLLDVNAFATEPLALAPLAGGRALLAYRGADGKGYFSIWDGTKVPVWTLPAPVGASVESTPAVGRGVCGADGVIAWAKTGGGAEVATITNGAASAPASVSGTAGAKYVGVATLP
jgi:hypothetical protein